MANQTKPNGNHRNSMISIALFESFAYLHDASTRLLQISAFFGLSDSSGSVKAQKQKYFKETVFDQRIRPDL